MQSVLLRPVQKAPPSSKRGPPPGPSAGGRSLRSSGGRVWTVDISDGAMEACRRRTADYAASVEYVVEDSIEFLRRWASGYLLLDY